jgi:hypothetical protein
MGVVRKGSEKIDGYTLPQIPTFFRGPEGFETSSDSMFN